ncbi:MAG: murein biosynthesis integral membrane protein MurJ [Desulfobacterales bacterium]|nr:MAG: murein biosynthesis integral membrane protein MurJ [Desulfobacterales bacterium]
MAFGTLIGGFCQLAIQLPSLYRIGFRYRPQLNIKDSGLIQILKLMLPATIGLSATQLNIFINTNFAASCAEGSVSWINYAFRLVQLPIGIFGVALSIAVLPLMAKQAANKEIDTMKETLVSSLTMVFALTLPATAGLILLAKPIIHLLFEHGVFTAADTIATANTLVFYAIGLFAYSANKVLVPAFYALEKTRYPVIASFLAVGLNLIIVFFTIDHYQHLAIAFSTSCTMIINFLFLTVVLYHKLGGFSLRYLLAGLLKTGTATGAMVSALLLLIPFCQQWLDGTILRQIAGLFILISGAGLLYLLLLTALKLPELHVVTSNIYSRTRRS